MHSIIASAMCWRRLRPIGWAGGQASLSDASRGYWEGIDGGSLSGNHHSEAADVVDPRRMGFMVKVFGVANSKSTMRLVYFGYNTYYLRTFFVKCFSRER